MPDMQFFTATVLLLTTSLLSFAEAEGSSTAESPSLGYSNVFALYADLQEKSALGQYQEAAELGVKAESFLITRTNESSSERADFYFLIAKLMSAAGYYPLDTAIEFSEKALRLQSNLPNPQSDKVLEAHAFYLNSLLRALRRSDTRTEIYSRLRGAVTQAERAAKGSTSKATGDLYRALSRASSTEKRAKSNLKTAADIYSKPLGIHAGLTLSTRIQLARFETDKKQLKRLLEIIPLFENDDASLQYKAAAQQRVSVLLLKQGRDEESFAQNAAPYETLKILGAQREFDIEAFFPVIKDNPEYPRVAQRKGISGYVILQYTVTETGTVEDITVLQASPAGVFDEAALQAAIKYRYLPRIVDGKPTRVTGVKTRITFEMI